MRHNRFWIEEIISALVSRHFNKLIFGARFID
jgi:hypothetical protein